MNCGPGYTLFSVFLLPAFLLASVGAPARGETSKSATKFTPSIGISVSTFTPSSGKTRDRFGGTWLDIGPDFGGGVPGAKAEISPAFNYTRQGHNGNEVLLIGAGAKYRRVLESRNGLTPYSGVAGYLTYGRVDVPSEGGRSSHTTVSAAPFLGAAIGRNVFTEARYYVYPEFGGYNFSGLELRLGARF